MLQDSLRESWTYQKVLEEGRAEGYEEGRVQVARETITLFAEKRFPATLTCVQERLEQISDLQTLHEIEEALFSANTEDEARQAFAPTHKGNREALQ